jgi:hypothetical protein
MAHTSTVLWEGLSPVDNTPIVAIATGLGKESKNAKTGAMVQIWILLQNVAPHDAVKSGEDQAVCGHCPLRGNAQRGRTCYVQVAKAPLSVWKSYKAGRIPHSSTDVLRNKFVRLGAYGDPAMLPPTLVKEIVRKAAGHTGYTHQWKKEFAQWAKGYLMASTEGSRQTYIAKKFGWATFQVTSDPSRVSENASHCLAESEGFSCETCMRCDGKSQREIYIVAHGPGKKHLPLVA